MKSANNIILGLVVALLSSGVTYILVSSSYEKDMVVLKEEIATLQKKVRDAVVTSRISAQMEDIAFQQKAISDVQRERAVEQTLIAEMERRKAEQERMLALAAQKKAVESAAEAKRQTERAEAQTVLATNNMLAAQEARAHADTLFYLARAKSLAQSSLSLSNNGNTDLSRLLSYAAWYYTDNYGGDRYQQDIFSSLLRSSDASQVVNLGLKGSIKKIVLANYGSDVLLYGVTDYGELFAKGPGGVEQMRFDTNFRDLLAVEPTRIVALDVKGRMVEARFDVHNGVPSLKGPRQQAVREQMLGAGKWTRLVISEDGKTLVAMSTHDLSWHDATTLAQTATAHLDGEITEIGMGGGELHVYVDKGVHYSSKQAGQVKLSRHSAVKEKITAYYYDKNYGVHVLGLATGVISFINSNGDIWKELIGHSGPITSLSLYKNMLASTSYDHTLKFWNVMNLSSVIMPFEQKFDKWPLTFDFDRRASQIWVGTEAGSLVNFCFSATENSKAIQQKLTREFTTEEWDYYMGHSVPYRNLINRQGKDRK